jgi:hypothetical protein
MLWVLIATPRPLYPLEKADSHCIGGWVGLRAGLDGCGKSRSHRDSILQPSSPQRGAISTELSQPRNTRETELNCIMIAIHMN